VDYLGGANGSDLHRSLMRLATSSVARDVVIPWQDILGLGTEARLNVPGKAEGNGTWRYDPQMVTAEVQDRLAQLH
jgi:4-alpha-glucanotransferase